MIDNIRELFATSGSEPRAILTCHAGRTPYAEAWELQQNLQRLLIDAKRAESPQIVPNFLVTVEHPPVYTLGKSGDEANLLASETELARKGASFFQTDRGGDITYHGPGQLVGYPILDLDRYFTDIGRYLRTLEEIIITVCASYGLAAGRVKGRTGVWIDIESGNERKICAFGIRCSRWVTMHGFAFNVNTDLAFYDDIIPCGIRDRGVTSLAKELGREIDADDCRSRVVSAFGEAFDAKVTSVDYADLSALLETLRSPENVAHP